MKATYKSKGIKIYQSDVLDVLRRMPDGMIHCCVTSPPYFGLRDYGTAKWEGGNAECDHLAPPRGGRNPKTAAKQLTSAGTLFYQYTHICGKCGANRIDQQIGLESTPDEYIQRIVEVFREVRRVLRNDGILWLNLGDCYAGGNTGNQTNVGQRYGKNNTESGHIFRKDQISGIKPKDLLGIPWRVALALQADNWWLRQDIIWHRPNPMPESVTDRCTKAHEYVFLLAKSKKYYFDADAIKEPSKYPCDNRKARQSQKDYDSQLSDVGQIRAVINPKGAKTYPFRNKRSVWTIASKPFKGAHFATFPPALVEPMIKAGTSERGACPVCGAPWKRIVERTAMVIKRSERTHDRGHTRSSGTMIEPPSSITVGWEPTCEHQHEPVPCKVLDIFIGSGTTAEVARKLGRRCIGIELNPNYVQLAAKRLETVK